MASGTKRVARFLRDPQFQEQLRAVVRQIRHRAPDLIEEEDLFQEVSAKGLANQAQFRGKSRNGCLAWLRTIANNHVTDLQRKHAKRPAKVSLTEAMQAHDSADVTESLETVLQSLSLSAEELALLKAWANGLHFKHIATILGASETATRKRFWRLLNWVSSELEWPTQE